MHLQLWTDDDEELVDDLADFNIPKDDWEMAILEERVREMMRGIPEKR